MTCVLYKSDKCCNTLIGKLQDGLDNYVEWGRNINMHASKTKAVLVTAMAKHNMYQPLIAGDRHIQYVHRPTFNYLSAMIDDQLSFTP